MHSSENQTNFHPIFACWNPFRKMATRKNAFKWNIIWHALNFQFSTFMDTRRHCIGFDTGKGKLCRNSLSRNSVRELEQSKQTFFVPVIDKHRGGFDTLVVSITRYSTDEANSPNTWFQPYFLARGWFYEDQTTRWITKNMFVKYCGEIEGKIGTNSWRALYGRTRSATVDINNEGRPLGNEERI